MGEHRDPVATLQSGVKGSERIDAYRDLARVEEIPSEVRAMARKLLIDGATTEYSVLARASAVAALAHYPEPDVVGALVKASEDRSPIVRVEACHSLREVLKVTKQADGVNAVTQLATSDPDPDVRIAATGALVALEDKETVNSLMECLKDEELAVAHRAADGLRKITGAPVSTDKYLDWKTWADGGKLDPNVQQTADKRSGGLGFMNLFRR